MNDLRVSDRDREAVMARLGAAAGEGRLALAEFGDRSGQACAAKTYGELEALVADLPPAQREHRSPVVDHTGPVLSLLALAAGVIWMPLFRTSISAPSPEPPVSCSVCTRYAQAVTLFAVRRQSWAWRAAQLARLCKSPGSPSTC